MSGDTWRAMWTTHSKPCVNMHGSYEAYIRGFTWAVGEAKRAQDQSVGAARRRGREGRRRRRKGEEKGRKGKEKRKGGNKMRKERRKEKKKGEEERKKKEEEEGVLCSEQTRTAKNPELRYKR